MDFMILTPSFTLPFWKGFRALAIGDWGTGGVVQQNVANAMAYWCETRPADFIIALGDNFYPFGVDSPYDVQFEMSWRDVYVGESIVNLTWFISVGNHDHYCGEGCELNQVYI